MVFKILLLLAVAGATWWLTRPQGLLRGGKRGSRKLVQCKNCGVYNEDGTSCKCHDKKGDKSSDKSGDDNGDKNGDDNRDKA